MQEVTIKLVCWCCRKELPIVVSQPPQFAYEVAQWANDVGWVGAMDLHWKRALVFCGDDCKEQAKTKDKSRFRKYPPKIKPMPVNDSSKEAPPDQTTI